MLRKTLLTSAARDDTGRWWNGTETGIMAEVWHKNAERRKLTSISRSRGFPLSAICCLNRKLPRVSDRTTTRSKLVNSSQSDLKKNHPRWPTPTTPLPRRRRPRRRCSNASSGTTSTAWSACTPRPPAIRPCRTRRSGAGRIGIINLLVSFRLWQNSLFPCDVYTGFLYGACS